jgi:hypothetical protein
MTNEIESSVDNLVTKPRTIGATQGRCTAYRPLTEKECHEAVVKPLHQNAITHRLNRFTVEQSILLKAIRGMRDPLQDPSRDRLLLETTVGICQAFSSKYGPLPMVEIKEIGEAWSNILDNLLLGTCCICESREPTLLKRITEKVTAYCSEEGLGEQAVEDGKRCRRHLLALLYAVTKVLSDAVNVKLAPPPPKPQFDIQDLYAKLKERGATV